MTATRYYVQLNVYNEEQELAISDALVTKYGKGLIDKFLTWQ